MQAVYNKPIKCGTAKAWLSSALLHSLAKHYQPLIGALSTRMNQNQKDLVVIFLVFVTVTVVLASFDLVVMALFTAGFAGLAWLERTFRWYKECSRSACKVVSIICTVVIWAPFLYLLTSYVQNLT